MDKSHLINFFDKMFFLQVIACLLEFFYEFQIGDPLTGTLISAHYLGLFLVVYLFVLLRCSKSILRFSIILKIVSAVVLLSLVDAKHICLVFIFSFFLNKICNYLNIRCSLLFICSCVVLFLVFLPNIANNSDFRNIVHNTLFEPYIYNTNYNKKYEYISNVSHYVLQTNGILGYGVGQFGSQISISLSKGLIYEWDDSIIGFKKAIYPFYDCIKGIMTKDYVEYGIPTSSMVLGYPLVSFIAMLSELGIIGFLLFMWILDKKFKYSDKTFLITFFFICLFDTYFEIPCCFLMIFLGIIDFNSAYFIKKCRKKQLFIVKTRVS